MIKHLYIALTALLLPSLAPMPYGYYQLVRFVAMVVFAIMTFNYYKEKKNELSIIFGALALLFQPFIKVALGRMMWNVVDVIVALLMVVLFLQEKNKDKHY